MPNGTVKVLYSTDTAKIIIFQGGQFAALDIILRTELLPLYISRWLKWAFSERCNLTKFCSILNLGINCRRRLIVDPKCSFILAGMDGWGVGEGNEAFGKTSCARLAHLA